MVEFRRKADHGKRNQIQINFVLDFCGGYEAIKDAFNLGIRANFLCTSIEGGEKCDEQYFMEKLKSYHSGYDPIKKRNKYVLGYSAS